MTGHAQFAYTDADMMAAQRAGWSWFARWRNLLIAYLGIALFNVALLAVLNAAYGTRPVPADPLFVVAGAATEAILFFGLMLWLAQIQGRRVLSSPKQGMPWNGDELRGEHDWRWDGNGLHIRYERGRADLAWSSVGAWLTAPDVFLLFPADGRPFSMSERTLAAGWREAPKIFLYPSGGYALALPKRVLPAGDADALTALLRTAGVGERRRFGVIAAKGGGAFAT